MLISLCRPVSVTFTFWKQLSMFAKIKSIVDLCVLVKQEEVIKFVKLNKSQNSSNLSNSTPQFVNINIEVPHDNKVFVRLTGFPK